MYKQFFSGVLGSQYVQYGIYLLRPCVTGSKKNDKQDSCWLQLSHVKIFVIKVEWMAQ
jgi:hypothetical protein